MVQVAASGQLVAIAEADRGEIVPRRVFNLNGVTGRAGRQKVSDDVDYDRA
jgi:tRNA pseudouridine55 synthase